MVRDENECCCSLKICFGHLRIKLINESNEVVQLVDTLLLCNLLLSHLIHHYIPQSQFSAYLKGHVHEELGTSKDDILDDKLNYIDIGLDIIEVDVN